MIRIVALIFISFSFSSVFYTQKNTTTEENNKSDLAPLYDGLEFRSIGPALMSGRISDIVIHPNNENVWYVSAGSGGVWKTENSGTTWNSLFDGQKSYSIGCITLDPQKSGSNLGGNR